MYIYIYIYTYMRPFRQVLFEDVAPLTGLIHWVTADSGEGQMGSAIRTLLFASAVQITPRLRRSAPQSRGVHSERDKWGQH